MSETSGSDGASDGPHGVRGRESGARSLESFETDDDDLVVHDPENRAAYVRSDRWLRAPP